MSSEPPNKPNLRFEHVYALVRFAKLNAAKRCCYKLQITRLDEGDA